MAGDGGGRGQTPNAMRALRTRAGQGGGDWSATWLREGEL
jgi:hypothetical protein